MDRVCQDRVPVTITREGAQPIVMLSLDEYESIEETAHLLRSPVNARRLLKAIESLAKGEGKERSINLET